MSCSNPLTDDAKARADAEKRLLDESPEYLELVLRSHELQAEETRQKLVRSLRTHPESPGHSE